jgi:hypothetical protein
MQLADEESEPVALVVEPVVRFTLPDEQVMLVLVAVVRLAASPVGELERLSSGGPFPLAFVTGIGSGCPETDVVRSCCQIFTFLRSNDVDEHLLLCAGFDGDEFHAVGLAEALGLVPVGQGFDETVAAPVWNFVATGSL